MLDLRSILLKFEEIYHTFLKYFFSGVALAS